MTDLQVETKTAKLPLNLVTTETTLSWTGEIDRNHGLQLPHRRGSVFCHIRGSKQETVDHQYHQQYDYHWHNQRQRKVQRNFLV